MNNQTNSTPYANWPLYIGNPNLSLDVRESLLGIFLLASVGSIFAIPGIYAAYNKTRSPLALVSLLYVLITTLTLITNIFFDFRSLISPLVGTYHNSVELMIVLLSISKGTLQFWHLPILALYISGISLSILLLRNSVLGFSIFGSAGLVLDITVAYMWILLLLENRRNPGTNGQRSGLIVFVISSLGHLFGSLFYSVGNASLLILSNALFAISTMFSIHLTVFAVNILERSSDYEMKWTAIWWKWIPLALVCIYVLFATFFLVS